MFAFGLQAVEKENGAPNLLVLLCMMEIERGLVPEDLLPLLAIPSAINLGILCQ